MNKQEEIIKKFPFMLREILKNHIIQIILFGSRARGDYLEDSDFDFLVIVDQKNSEIEDKIDTVSGSLFYEYSTLIGPIVWDESEWEFHKRFPIGINILKEGISL